MRESLGTNEATPVVSRQTTAKKAVREGLGMSLQRVPISQLTRGSTLKRMRGGRVPPMPSQTRREREVNS